MHKIHFEFEVLLGLYLIVQIYKIYTKNRFNPLLYCGGNIISFVLKWKWHEK